MIATKRSTLTNARVGSHARRLKHANQKVLAVLEMAPCRSRHVGADAKARYQDARQGRQHTTDARLRLSQSVLIG
jgi:hypothetical protein